VSRGCPAFCSFCFEGYERKPYREVPLEEALARARFLKREYGARTVELDAFNLNMYADFVPLVKACAKLFDRLSFKSQRADGIAACPEIIDLERACGKQSFTLGIEGISERMRAFLCKSLTTAQIDAALKVLLVRRVREIKLFYILTGHEGPEDLAVFGTFCSRLQELLRAPRCGTRVVLSFGRLVRMPNTPLMFDRLLLDEEAWRFCVDGVSAACRRAKLEFRFAFDWPDYVGTQLLASCRHEDAPAVVKLASEGLSYHGPWQPADAAKLQAVVSAPLKAVQPFPFVRRPVSEAFLKQRWEDACAYRDEGFCLGQSCAACGACVTPEEKKSLVRHPRMQEIATEDIDALAQLEVAKRQLTPLYLRVHLPAGYSGRGAEVVNAEVMRHLLLRFPELMDNLLSVEEALFTAGENDTRFLVPSGETVMAFRAWDRKALLSALASAAPLINGAVPAGFQPGVFSKASCLLYTTLLPRDVAQSASQWLNTLHLPHTLCRAGEGWLLDPAPAALKKKVLYACSVQPVEGGSCVSLDFSSKLDLRDWLLTLPCHPTQPRVTCQSVDATR
jgi:Radical SAM superfamily